MGFICANWSDLLVVLYHPSSHSPLLRPGHNANLHLFPLASFVYKCLNQREQCFLCNSFFNEPPGSERSMLEALIRWLNCLLNRVQNNTSNSWHMKAQVYGCWISTLEFAASQDFYFSNQYPNNLENECNIHSDVKLFLWL